MARGSWWIFISTIQLFMFIQLSWCLAPGGGSYAKGVTSDGCTVERLYDEHFTFSDINIRVGQQVPVSRQLQVRCKPRYQMTGRMRINCTSSGQWHHVVNTLQCKTLSNGGEKEDKVNYNVTKPADHVTTMASKPEVTRQLYTLPKASEQSQTDSEEHMKTESWPSPISMRTGGVTSLGPEQMALFILLFILILFSIILLLRLHCHMKKIECHLTEKERYAFQNSKLMEANSIQSYSYFGEPREHTVPLTNV